MDDQDLRPRHHPCVVDGTAVYDTSTGNPSTRTVDCAATVESGRCPWRTERAAANVTHPNGSGAGWGCWYRTVICHTFDAVLGGHDAPSLRQLLEADLDPARCRRVADTLEQQRTTYRLAMLYERSNHIATCDDVETRVNHDCDVYDYTTWWFRWCAERGEGATRW